MLGSLDVSRRWAASAAWLLLVACVALPGSALARDTLKDAGHHQRPQMLSVFSGFHVGYYHGGLPVALSGRYYYPIVPDGFGSTINDEFGIEGGIDLLFQFGSSDHFGVGLPVAGMYDLHFSETFDAYAKLGFSLHIDKRARPYPYAAVGMRLRLNDSLFFRAEAGYPMLLVGLGFAF